MPEDNPKTLTPAQAWVDVLCAVTGTDYRIRSNAGRAARLGKELREAGGMVVEVERHYGQRDAGAAWWWYRDDWRGKRGQRPTFGQLAETWGQWTLPVAVEMPMTDAGRLLAYAQELRRGDDKRSD